MSIFIHQLHDCTRAHAVQDSKIQLQGCRQNIMLHRATHLRDFMRQIEVISINLVATQEVRGKRNEYEWM